MTYDEMVKKLGYSTCTRSGNDHTVTRKEHKPMDFANAKIVVGNRVYTSTYVDFEPTHGNYPRIAVEAVLDPRIATPYSAGFAQLSIKEVIFNPPATTYVVRKGAYDIAYTMGMTPGVSMDVKVLTICMQIRY